MFTHSDIHQFTVNSLPLAHTQTHCSQVKLQPFSNLETSIGTIMVNFSPKPAGRYFSTAGASQAERNDFPQDFWISFAIRHKLIRSDMISNTIRKQLTSNSAGRGNPCKWIAANCDLQRCMITIKKRLEFTTLKQGGFFLPPSNPLVCLVKKEHISRQFTFFIPKPMQTSSLDHTGPHTPDLAGQSLLSSCPLPLDRPPQTLQRLCRPHNLQLTHQKTPC